MNEKEKKIFKNRTKNEREKKSKGEIFKHLQEFYQHYAERLTEQQNELNFQN